MAEFVPKSDRQVGGATIKSLGKRAICERNRVNATEIPKEALFEAMKPDEGKSIEADLKGDKYAFAFAVNKCELNGGNFVIKMCVL